MRCVDFYLATIIYSIVPKTLWGFGVGAWTGFAAGLVLGRNDRLARILEPYIVAFNSLPRIALVPLITMMFGFGLVAKVVLALGIKQLEHRLLRWRPEHRERA